MRPLSFRARAFAVAGAAGAVMIVFAYVALRAGPLAPVPVTVAAVASRPVAPAIFGTGTVEARYAYRIGPTASGRVKRVEVQVGDFVKAGQLLGEIDSVDLDDRLAAQEAAVRRAQASVVASESQRLDAAARARNAEAQRRRYDELRVSGMVSSEMVEAKRQDHEVALANVAAARANGEAAREELARNRAEREALARQRANLRLVAPADGLVTARDAEPGTTVVAGQTVIEIVDPASVWINVRFDQASAAGLRAGLPAGVVLRSRPGAALAGRVIRVEPRADAVTEELLAKVAIEAPLPSLPPLGELVEVTVAMAALPPSAVVSNASVQRIDGRAGVWVVDEGEALRFRPVKVGATDLEGWVQVLEGLAVDERVVVHSQRALGERSRVRVVERLAGAQR